MTDTEPVLAAGLDAYLGALLQPDPREARRTVEQMLETGTPGRSIYLRILQPALRRVGQLWELARITVAQEHLATVITMGVMARLAPSIGEAPVVNRRIILACSPGELHGVGLRMVADFLEGDGWEVLEIGPATPTADLVSIVRAEHPDVVGLSTALTLHLVDAKGTVEALHAVAPRPLVLVGGAAYGGDGRLGDYVGADAFAADAGEASALLRRRFGS